MLYLRRNQDTEAAYEREGAHMNVFINIDEAIGIHSREVEKLKKEGTFEEIQKYIRPYLIEGEIFPESREEFLLELRKAFAEEDIYEIAEHDHPDVPYVEWNGFHVIFILDWTDTYWSLDAWDYVSISMMKRWNITPEILLGTAVDNMKMVPTKYRELTSEERGMLSEGNLAVVMVECDIYVFPPYTCSIMMRKAYMEQLRNHLGDFYIIPYSKDRLFLISEKCLTHPETQLWDICTSIETTEYFQKDFISERFFYYKNHKIMILPNSP